jgi:uncharacterized protein
MNVGIKINTNIAAFLQRHFPSSCCIHTCSTATTTDITTHATTRSLNNPIRNKNKYNHNTNYNANTKYQFSSIPATRGQDLLADSLAHGTQRKMIIDSYYPETGIDVLGMIEYRDDITDIEDIVDEKTNIVGDNKNVEDVANASDIAKIGMRKGNNSYNINEEDENHKPQNLLMNSSIIVFPNSCFLWNEIYEPKDVTLESLSIVQLLTSTTNNDNAVSSSSSTSAIEFLFIGCDKPLPPRELNRIKKVMKEKSGIVVEQMDVMNAMGTFNILNGEDRRVAVALVVDVKNENED